MLSEREKQNVRKGAKLIRAQMPLASCEQMLHSFTAIFGKGLSKDELIEAHSIIKEEFKRSMN